MSKADRDRQALLQRLAREQRRALNAAARDADAPPRRAPLPHRGAMTARRPGRPSSRPRRAPRGSILRRSTSSASSGGSPS